MESHPFPELRETLDEIVDEVADVFEAMHDTITLGTDRLVRDLGEDGTGRLADLLVTDDERAALETRALGRTLKEIDRLPTT
jgi:hypothetical protein